MNLNSFVARLYEAKVAHFAHFAIWQLKAGLEINPPDMESPSIVDTSVLVSCEWIVRGGRRIFEASLRNELSETQMDTSTSDPYGVGSLFGGVGAFNLERWGFWKRRVTEVRT